MPTRPPVRIRAVLVVAITILASVTLGSVASPAHATALGVHIPVDGFGGANGSVAAVGGPITSVLTASGAGTCALTNAEVVIAPPPSEDPGHNPSLTHTPGAPCHLYDAVVVYTLTWYSVGVPGTFQRVCAWELGTQVCTAEGVTL